MQSDMTVVGMTGREQKLYPPHDSNTRRLLPCLPATMSNSRLGNVIIVMGSYCRDTSCLEKLEEKGQQHANWKRRGRHVYMDNNVESWTYICGCIVSLFKSNNASKRLLGIEGLAAKTSKEKIHELFLC